MQGEKNQTLTDYIARCVLLYGRDDNFHQSRANDSNRKGEKSYNFYSLYRQGSSVKEQKSVFQIFIGLKTTRNRFEPLYLRRKVREEAKLRGLEAAKFFRGVPF